MKNKKSSSGSSGHESDEEFSISSRVCSLCLNDKVSNGEEINPLISPNTRYRVPIYQRPYSWGEEELQRFMEDLHNAYINQEPFFMGTMQLSESLGQRGRNSRIHSFDVIDGQQRLTTFMILIYLLEKDIGARKSILTEDFLTTEVNGGSAQEDLNELLRNKNLKFSDEPSQNRNCYRSNAAIILRELENRFFSKEENEQSKLIEGDERRSIACQLYNFIQKKLRFVIIETRAGLSKMLKIFDSINTTGMDLATSDIFKLRLYEHRRNNGDEEKVFENIVALYQKIDGLKGKEGYCPSMEEVLEAYKRVLIAKHNMSKEATKYSTKTFFDRLFDTILHNREWKDFKAHKDIILELDDLHKLVQCFEMYAQNREKNELLRIYDDFIQNARYKEVWMYTIIALFFDAIKQEQILDFHKELFKLLVPPSLFNEREVKDVKHNLIELYVSLKPENGQSKNGMEILRAWKKKGLKEDMKPKEMFDEACDMPIAENPTAKYLLCLIVEWLQSGRKQCQEVLFDPEIDIEHIQCYTDEKYRDKIWKEWGDEINKLGNLVILERSSNRSQKNKKEAKEGNYRNSDFASARALADKVNGWKKEDAEKRREKLTKRIWAFLSSDE